MDAKISIHALREEGDPLRWCSLPCRRYFYPRPPRGGRLSFHVYDRLIRLISIHALREEGDRLYIGVLQPGKIFLSTPSARRATRRTKKKSAHTENFYPRPPRGGRLVLFSLLISNFYISIHALREEGDKLFLPIIYTSSRFLSTPSARRATSHRRVRWAKPNISIHALREEGDCRRSSTRKSSSIFLSTPSARRATF